MSNDVGGGNIKGGELTILLIKKLLDGRYLLLDCSNDPLTNTLHLPSLITTDVGESIFNDIVSFKEDITLTRDKKFYLDGL